MKTSSEKTPTLCEICLPSAATWPYTSEFITFQNNSRFLPHHYFIKAQLAQQEPLSLCKVTPGSFCSSTAVWIWGAGGAGANRSAGTAVLRDSAGRSESIIHCSSVSQHIFPPLICHIQQAGKYVELAKQEVNLCCCCANSVFYCQDHNWDNSVLVFLSQNVLKRVKAMEWLNDSLDRCPKPHPQFIFFGGEKRHQCSDVRL